MCPRAKCVIGLLVLSLVLSLGSCSPETSTTPSTKELPAPSDLSPLEQELRQLHQDYKGLEKELWQLQQNSEELEARNTKSAIESSRLLEEAYSRELDLEQETSLLEDSLAEMVDRYERARATTEAERQNSVERYQKLRELQADNNLLKTEKEVAERAVRRLERVIRGLERSWTRRAFGSTEELESWLDNHLEKVTTQQLVELSCEEQYSMHISLQEKAQEDGYIWGSGYTLPFVNISGGNPSGSFTIVLDSYPMVTSVGLNGSIRSWR